MSQIDGIRQRRPLRPQESNQKDEIQEEPQKIVKKRWYCSTILLFFGLLSARLLSAMYNLIWDCDETYNYWEPLHYSLYKHGFQTWEYSPEYSLRSYLYIYLHTICLLPFKYLGLTKVQLFYAMRILFALISAKFETNFVKSINGIYGNRVGKLVFLLLLTNVGMFLSSTSFLPSTFSMYLIMNSYSYWFSGQFKGAIFQVALATLLGWPFVSILGLPIILDILFSMNMKKIFGYFVYSIFSGIVISGVIIAFDSYFYGLIQFAPLNIILYNVFPKSTAHGPDIYGREPLSYYLINCTLNHNIIFAFGLINILIILFSKTNLKQKLTFFSFALWLLVFFTRPHKEERFLYPIYPLLIVLAAHTIDYFSSKCKLLSKFIPFMIVLIHASLSILRFLALFNNYSAQMDVFAQLNNPQIKYAIGLESKEQVNVCIGKEWYRYSSSFFLPESYSRQKWRLKFIESNFKGQLPGEFNESLEIPESTRVISKEFNDINAEIKSRYLDLNKCDYFIDTMSNKDLKNNQQFNSKWSSVYSAKFINFDASKSPYRAIYLPTLYEKNVKFTKFHIFKRI